MSVGSERAGCQGVGMTPPPSPIADQPPPAAVRRPVRLALAVSLLLATFGGFGLAFGAMTACTNDYSCTVSACAPCATVNSRVTAHWAAQVVLLGVAGVLAVLASLRVRPRAVRTAARLIPLLGLLLLVAAYALASTGR